VGWGKVACWSTKAAISLKSIKIEQKILWGAYYYYYEVRIGTYQPTLFRTASSPTPYTPYCLLFPKIGGSRPPPKTPIVIISGMGKATGFSFGRYIRPSEQNAIKNFGEKGTKARKKNSGKVAMDVVRDSRKFSWHPYIGRIARLSL